MYTLLAILFMLVGVFVLTILSCNLFIDRGWVELKDEKGKE